MLLKLINKRLFSTHNFKHINIFVFTFLYRYAKIRYKYNHLERMIPMTKKDTKTPNEPMAEQVFKNKMDEAGIGREDLAELCGVEIETVKLWEEGKVKPPKEVYKMFEAVREALKKPENKDFTRKLSSLPNSGDLLFMIDNESRLIDSNETHQQKSSVNKAKKGILKSFFDFFTGGSKHKK